GWPGDSGQNPAPTEGELRCFNRTGRQILFPHSAVRVPHANDVALSRGEHETAIWTEEGSAQRLVRPDLQGPRALTQDRGEARPVPPLPPSLFLPLPPE